MTLVEFLLARIAADEADFPAMFVDQQRVARECEAKRRIVEMWMAYGREGIGDWRDGYTAALEDVVGFLALPYADHPDYNPEWRP